MGKFLFKIFIFAVIMIAIMASVELCLMTVPNDISIKAKYIHEHPNDINTLILGNSQVLMGLKPDLLGDSVFNYAYFLKSPYYDYYHLLEAATLLPNLRCVIWDISYDFHDFNTHNVKTYRRNYDNSNICKYYKYTHVSPLGSFAPLFWWESIWSAYEGPVLMRIINRKPFDYSDKGWIGYDTMPIEPEIDALNTDIGPDTLPEALVAAKNENIHYCVGLAELCREHGYRMIVVMAPCYKTYTARVNNIGMEEITECLTAMQKVYPQLEFYDYFKDPRFVAEDYFDEDHLSRTGAYKFTQIFKDEVYDKHME